MSGSVGLNSVRFDNKILISDTASGGKCSGYFGSSDSILVLVTLSSSSSKGKGKAKDGDAEEDEEVQKNLWWETFLGNFTLYLDLRNARTDSDFEAVLHQLKMEWTFMGGFVSILALSP